MSVVGFLRKHLRAMHCREAVSLMTEYLEDALAERDRERLEAHISGCAHCTEYLAQLRAVIDALGRPEPDDLDTEALDELVGLYRQWRSS